MGVFKKLAILGLLAGCFAGAFAADVKVTEEVIGRYGAITVKRLEYSSAKIFGLWQYTETKSVAYIDDNNYQKPTSIPVYIGVDSVYYNRNFKAGVAQTLMLPFEVETYKTGLDAFEYVAVVLDCPRPYCSWQVRVRQAPYANTLKANTPYVVIPKSDTRISIGAKQSWNSDQLALNTSKGSKKVSNTANGLQWTFIGTYEYIKFTDPSGIYGFAAKSKNGTKVGDFVKGACKEASDGSTSCPYIKPFRGYLRCTLADKPLAKGVIKGDVSLDNEISSLEELPESIEIHVIEDDNSTTYLGKLHTSTGEITDLDKRWYDMKGRKMDHQPNAAGTYYNNNKNVIVK